MSKLFNELSSKAQRGSKPRCHLLTDGSPDIVAARLTALATPFATISPSDRWMPKGFSDCGEAELDKADRLLDPARRKALAAWWLPSDRQGARTPNFDVASTCTIDGRPGLLLIEAKAHDHELTKEAAGRQLRKEASEERRASHPTIGAAIESARMGLASATGHGWGISRDSHYQISNRFAWCWKLAELGVPIVLVYLGFLRATEMTDKGSPLMDGAAWEKLVLYHSRGLFPAEIWEQRWSVSGATFVSLIRSVSQPLERATS